MILCHGYNPEAKQLVIHSANQFPPIVFIVGMPRSGTKLLRDLLNRHSSIAIFPNESHFIPALHRKYGDCSDLDNVRAFGRFYREFRTTAFCRRIESRGILLEEDEWRKSMSGGKYSDIIRAMFTIYRSHCGVTLVGDKTPEYLTQLPLLAHLLPEARFIHIIRDPRDYALSIRNAWGKDLARATYRWKRHVSRFRDDAAVLAGQQVTVKYEDLLDSPADVLSRLCAFLEVPFQQQMTSLAAPAEELGDAKGMSTILAHNTGKWKDKLSSQELNVVESMVGVLMTELGYSPATAPGDADLPWLREVFGRAFDAISLFRYRRRMEGSFGSAIRESWRAHRHSAIEE